MAYRFNAATVQFFQKVEQAELFTSVGHSLDGPYERVTSWKEALKKYRSLSYKNSWIEARNDLADQLPKAIYQTWNNVAAASEWKLTPMLDRKLSEALNDGRMPGELVELRNLGLYWDLMHRVLELEYEEFVKPGIFAEKADLYLRGFFPCGWRGIYPKGRLIVF